MDPWKMQVLLDRMILIFAGTVGALFGVGFAFATLAMDFPWGFLFSMVAVGVAVFIIRILDGWYRVFAIGFCLGAVLVVLINLLMLLRSA